MTYELRLKAFEGPFDLLLFLIKKNEIDIYDIPIAEITDQYLEYLAEMEEMDLEVASSFLIMAANLLAIKANMLLPKPIPDNDEDITEDYRSELVNDLLEYMAYKEAAGLLERFSEKESQYVARPNEDELYLNLFSEVNPLEGKTISDLTSAFKDVLKQLEKKGKVVSLPRDEYTVKDKILYIDKLLAGHPRGICFSDIFIDCHSKMELVVTFLALLELVRRAAIKIAQKDAYESIYLYPLEKND